MPFVSLAAWAMPVFSGLGMDSAPVRLAFRWISHFLACKNAALGADDVL